MVATGGRLGAGHSLVLPDEAGFRARMELALRSRMVGSGLWLKLTTVVLGRGVDGAGDDNYPLQSTLALSLSPVHNSDGEGSSSEETTISFSCRSLAQWLFLSLFAISSLLRLALRSGLLLSVACLEWFRTAFWGRGGFAGMMPDDLNCERKD